MPGFWRCAKCNFMLVQSTLNAHDGSVTARDEAGTYCPNDNSPMWRVSWKEHAMEMNVRCEEAITEGGNLREALKPFAEFGRGDGLQPSDLIRDRICDWFGPSDFDRAANPHNLDAGDA